MIEHTEIKAMEGVPTSSEVVDAFDEFMRAFEAYKQANDERLAQIEGQLAADVVTGEKMARIDRAIDEHRRVVDDLVMKARRPALHGTARGPMTGIEGPQGPTGAQGQGIEPDAAGTLAERDAFDDEAQGFVYLRTDVTPFEFYVKASAASGDWAGPSTMAGDGTDTLATNVSFLSLLVADLLGDRIDIVEGWVDPFDDEGDVDTGSSANQTYDAAGDYYSPAVSATFESIFAVTLDADANGYGGFTIRNVIDAAALGSVAFTPEQARVSLRAGSSEGFTVTAAYIGHKAGSGDPYDFSAAPVQITFDGGAAAMVIGAGSEVVSDAVDFAWNGTSGLVVSIYCNGGGSSDMLRKKDAVANAESYIKAENLPSTVNVSGYSADADVQLLSGIEVAEATGMLEMDLLSSAFTASAEPDEAKLLIEVEEVDAASANTDFRGYVSRDGGSSWEEGALALRLTTPAGRKIYEAVGIDLSAQGPGTDIRARFTTHNAKDVRLHGWAFSVG